MEEVFAAGPQIGEPVVGIEIDIVDGAEHRLIFFFEAQLLSFLQGLILLKFHSNFVVRAVPSRF